MNWINFIEIFFLIFLNIILAQTQPYGSFGYPGTNHPETEKSLVFDARSSTAAVKMADNNYRYDDMIRQVFKHNSDSLGAATDSSYRNNGNYPDNFNFKVQRNPDGRLDVVENPTNINKRISIHDPTTTRSGPIHFPTPPTRPINHNNLGIGNAPKCSAGGESFCTQVDNYPIDQVAKIIQKESIKFENVFGEDLIPEIPEVSQRIDPGEESLCTSVERLIFPQAALTKDNNWSFIVNHENYTQGVRIEECSNAGKPCAMTESFPNGYKTECKQKYIYRQMLGFNANGKVVKDLYRLPSCCKCIIKFH